MSIDDGGNPSPAPRAPGGALAELGARLSGDADLRHGGDSFGAEDLASARDAGSRPTGRARAGGGVADQGAHAGALSRKSSRPRPHPRLPTGTSPGQTPAPRPGV